MKILSYTGYRTGSRSLGEWLSSELGITYYHEPFNLNNPTSLKRYADFNLDNIDEGIIKISPRDDLKFSEVSSKFDKRIVLYRENTKEQAESILWANEKQLWHNTIVDSKLINAHYTIPAEWLDANTNEIECIKDSLEKEKELFKTLEDCILLTYEELYFSDLGIQKIEDYIGFKAKTKFNKIHKLRGGFVKKSLL